MKTREKTTKKQVKAIAIINDIDKDLIHDYRRLKKVSSDSSKYPQNLNTIKKITTFIHGNIKSIEDKLVKAIIIRSNGFGSDPVNTKSKIIYKPSNPYSKLKHIKEYKNRMKNTTILSKDWKYIVHKYDSKTTLFYLDPPYENTDAGIYDNNIIDYHEMRNILHNIKGKFLLSINGSSNIRNIFRDFRIRKLKLKTISRLKRKEVLISNFKITNFKYDIYV